MIYFEVKRGGVEGMFNLKVNPSATEVKYLSYSGSGTNGSVVLGQRCV